MTTTQAQLFPQLDRLDRLEAARLQREGYEQRLLRERPKYIPMKHENVARLSPEDREEYENSLKIKKHENVMLLEVDRTKFCKTF
jgi:hypothetical protein